MDFTVYSENGSRGGREDRYVGDDTFKVWDAIYGPTGWLRLEVAPNQADRPTFCRGDLR